LMATVSLGAPDTGTNTLQCSASSSNQCSLSPCAIVRSAEML
jgi:hypothetical protein